MYGYSPAYLPLTDALEVVLGVSEEDAYSFITCGKIKVNGVLVKDPDARTSVSDLIEIIGE